MDRLIEAIRRTGNPSVVGLDPKPGLLPKQLLETVAGLDDLAQAYLVFNQAIIDSVSDLIPAVKPQIAMYEALGPAGVDVYARTCAYAQSKGLYVLGDVKRGDIGSTAQAYAAHLSGSPALPGLPSQDVWHEDAVTVNPYLGIDGIRPFLDACIQADKDIFVLCKTSNPSSSQLQDLRTAGQSGAEDSAKTVSQEVAGLLEEWGKESQGISGYSRLGAVIGATHPQLAQDFRRRMPRTFFLVPGYGAQGGTAADVAALFDSQGRGAIINSSRGIIGAWKANPAYSEDLNRHQALDLLASSARKAVIVMKEDLTSVLDRGGRKPDLVRQPASQDASSQSGYPTTDLIR